MEFVLAFIGFMLALTAVSWLFALIAAAGLSLYQFLESLFRKYRHD